MWSTQSVIVAVLIAFCLGMIAGAIYMAIMSCNDNSELPPRALG